MQSGERGHSDESRKGAYGEGPVPGCGKMRLRIHRVFKDFSVGTQAPAAVERLTGGNKILARNAYSTSTYSTA